MKNIKTRFPPSPTGFLHVGGLRTALFCYLFAKKHGGTFVLRIEDTDRERLVEGAIENMINALIWAGIEIDEGVYLENGIVTQKGDCGPYVQSERLDLYKKYTQKLLDAGHAYYAFDTKEELTAMRERQQAAKQPTQYDRGAMRNQFTLSDEETKKLVEAGEYVVRMKMPDEGVTTFDDMVRGTVEFQNKLLDDQILMKADGYPTYHLANVVDDHLMEITHVIRGEEWVSSTPKHVVLYGMFGWGVPVFAHLPLLVNEKKAKLSKRHGDVSVEDFKEKGYLKEALVNFVAFLGWNPGDERELFSIEELVKDFDLTKVAKSAAVFNREKLAWYNRQYMMHMDLVELTELARPFFLHQSIELGDIDLTAAVDLERGRVDTLSELPAALGFLFSKDLSHDSSLLVWKKSTAEDAKEKLGLLKELLNEVDDWSRESLENTIMPWIKEQGFGNGDVLWPLRVALSGQKNSPGPFDIASVLGKEKTLSRIDKAIQQLT